MLITMACCGVTEFSSITLLLQLSLRYHSRFKTSDVNSSSCTTLLVKALFPEAVTSGHPSGKTWSLQQTNSGPPVVHKF